MIWILVWLTELNSDWVYVVQCYVYIILHNINDDCEEDMNNEGKFKLDFLINGTLTNLLVKYVNQTTTHPNQQPNHHEQALLCQRHNHCLSRQ